MRYLTVGLGIRQGSKVSHKFADALYLKEVRGCEMSKKRLHAPSSPESELIEIYEDLSSLDEAVRLRAAQALVVKHVQSGTFRDQNVLRILRRLLRGLSSGRKAARIGFSIALTESLTRVCKNSGQAELDLEVPATLFRNLKEQTDVNIQSSKQVGSKGLANRPSTDFAG